MGKCLILKPLSESSSSPSPTQIQEENDPVDNYTLDTIAYMNQLSPIEGESPESKKTKGMFKCFSHFLSKLGKKNEQTPTQKKRILGVDQLTKDPSSSGQKDLVFVKSSANDTKVSIPRVEIPWLSKAEGFILPNHDTGRILPAESQRNITHSLVVVIDSSITDYDSTDESSVCSTPLLLPQKLCSVEPISGSKTIKSILKSNSTFKAEALKCIIINEPSSVPIMCCRVGSIY
ncbi:hypothetical protein Tco_0502508 [Tanacetum coccineum]